MELIADHLYDLSKPVFFLHPNNKFWEITLEGIKVTFRVGKIKNNVESAEEKI